MKTMILRPPQCLGLALALPSLTAREVQSDHTVHRTPWCGCPGAGAERPRDRDGAEWAGGARLFYAVEPRNLAVRPVSRQRLTASSKQ